MMLKPKLFRTILMLAHVMVVIFISPIARSAEHQSFAVTGTIQDVGGHPIPGVTILIKNSLIGTISDSDGKFSITVPNAKTILVFSSIGYETQEIAVQLKTVLTVTLSESIAQIGDVVIVGYGTQKKVSVTGAVSAIDTKDLLKSSSPNIANALAGRISGLTSTQAGGGQPGMDNATLYLRGAGTVNTTNPLILIDGVPRDNMRTIDPNEVESISVLKDASATAVFGVRGANGVIIITTKRGQEGKAKLSVNVTQSFASFTKEPERLHSSQYLSLRNEALQNDQIELISRDKIELYENPLKGLDPSDPDYTSKAEMRRYMYPDHDYYREFIKKFAPQTTINANLSGGTKRLGYFLNVGYIHQGGNLKTEPESELGYNPSVRMDRWSFRSNLDYKITNSLKAFLNVGTYIETAGMPSCWSHGGDDVTWMIYDIFYQAQTILPISPGPTTIAGHGVEPGMLVEPTDINGSVYLDHSAFEIMNRFGFRKEVRTNLNSTFGLEWDLGNIVTKGLVVKGMISYDAYARTVTQSEKKERVWRTIIDKVEQTFNYAPYYETERNMVIGKYARTQYKINAQASISYNRSFGRHNISGMFVAQRDYWEVEAGDSKTLMPYNVIGIAGRATYNYDDRYFGEVNLGYNGSEQFSPNKRFGFFPATSIGWAISNEEFLKNNKVLTFLKLRASLGKVGNDRMGSDRFLYMDQISMNGWGYLGSLGQGQQVVEGLLGNYGVTWETALKWNLGLDFQLFDQLSGSIDFFHEKRSDILIQRNTIPVFQGVHPNNIPRVNMGEVENRGFEVELTYNKEIARNFHLMVKGNFGYNKNIQKYMDEVPLDDIYAYRYRYTGYSIGQQFGYLIDWDKGGYWTQELLDNDWIPYDFGNQRIGDFIYKDLNDDGRISEADKAPIGKGSVPRLSYGLTLALDYKGLDFSIFFQGLGGYHSYYDGNGVVEYTKQGTYYEYHQKAWTQERWDKGEEITYPALSTGRTTNHQPNTFFIQDRTFLRLKNLEVGYTLPAGILKSIGISNLRVFLSGQNLCLWDRLNTTHFDPEPNGSINYPVARTFSIGANITF